MLAVAWAVAIVDAMVSLLAGRGPGGMLWASPSAHAPGVAAMLPPWIEANGFVPARISIANLVQNPIRFKTIEVEHFLSDSRQNHKHSRRRQEGAQDEEILSQEIPTTRAKCSSGH